MKNLTREKMMNGEKCLGTMLTMGATGAVEGLALSGMDFIIIDTEHGPYDTETAMNFIRAAKLRGMTPYVRVKEISRTAVLKMLDVGAEALIVPCVSTVEEVNKLVEYAKYSPVGQRGLGMGRITGYGYEPFVKENGIFGYFETCNRETLLIPQCETLGCLNNIEEIAAIEGVDGIFIGPFDLSIALGKPTQFNDPEFENALKRVYQAVKKAGKFMMAYVGNANEARKYFQNGYDAIAVSTDANMLINHAKQIVEQSKEDL